MRTRRNGVCAYRGDSPKWSRRMDRTLMLSALVVALAGCTTAPDTATTDTAAPAASPSPTTLAAYHWDLARATDAQGQTIAVLQPQGVKPLRVDFADDRIAVSGGCNRIGGNAQLRDGALQIGPLMQ